MALDSAQLGPAPCIHQPKVTGDQECVRCTDEEPVCASQCQSQTSWSHEHKVTPVIIIIIIESSHHKKYNRPLGLCIGLCRKQRGAAALQAAGQYQL